MLEILNFKIMLNKLSRNVEMVYKDGENKILFTLFLYTKDHNVHYCAPCFLRSYSTLGSINMRLSMSSTSLY